VANLLQGIDLIHGLIYCPIPICTTNTDKADETTDIPDTPLMEQLIINDIANFDTKDIRLILITMPRFQTII